MSKQNLSRGVDYILEGNIFHESVRGQVARLEDVFFDMVSKDGVNLGTVFKLRTVTKGTAQYLPAEFSTKEHIRPVFREVENA